MIRPTGVRVSGAALRRMLGLPDGPPEHVTGVTLDSRRVRPGDLYAALPGFTTHGARFAAQAQAAGAAGILTDPSGADLIRAEGGIDVPVLVVDDPRGLLGAVSAWVYGDPARALATTGITGTNGKTTVSYLLDAALRAGGHTTGVIGTVATQIGDEVLPATRTTPEAPDLHALLAVMRERGASAVTMEVSSHALELGRVDGVHFDLAVFTNLSQDHLDFHGDMESYFAAKAQLFTAAAGRRGAGLRRRRVGPAAGGGRGRVPVTTYALDQPADWTVRDLRPDRTAPGAVQFTAVGPGGAGGRRRGRPGRTVQRGQRAGRAGRGRPPRRRAAAGRRRDPGLPRGPGQDGAGVRRTGVRGHRGLRAHPGRRGPGDRGDPGGRHRPGDHGPRLRRGPGPRTSARRMGEVAARDSDILVITDDNPRSESALAIREAIIGGTLRVDRRRRAQVLVEADRARAIGIAAGMAQPDDAVLVLGKGHEQGQEAAGSGHALRRPGRAAPGDGGSWRDQDRHRAGSRRRGRGARRLPGSRRSRSPAPPPTPGWSPRATCTSRSWGSASTAMTSPPPPMPRARWSRSAPDRRASRPSSSPMTPSPPWVGWPATCSTQLPDASVVAITGSSGKTTTKDLIATLLEDLGPTVAPAGSFNTEVGLPLTILRATEDTRFLVLEMGARGIGHIATLCRIAPPDVSVVLNVGSAHLGRVRQPRGDRARPRARSSRPWRPDGLAVLNADDPIVAAMAPRTARAASSRSDPALRRRSGPSG